MANPYAELEAQYAASLRKLREAREKNLAQIDKHLAESDERYAQVIAACSENAQAFVNLCNALSLEHDAAWIADNVVARIDDIGELIRQVIKLARASIPPVEAFDPPPARLPADD